MADLRQGVYELKARGVPGEEQPFDFLRSVGSSLVELHEAIGIGVLCGAVYRNYHEGGEELFLIRAENLYELVAVSSFENVGASGQHFSGNFHGTIEGDHGFVPG